MDNPPAIARANNTRKWAAMRVCVGVAKNVCATIVSNTNVPSSTVPVAHFKCSSKSRLTFATRAFRTYEAAAKAAAAPMAHDVPS